MVVRLSRPSSTRLITVRAVRPLVPLAIPNRVSTSFAISQPAMRETVCLDELDLVAPVDTHDAREGRLGGDPIDGVLQAAQSTAAIGSAISLASG